MFNSRVGCVAAALLALSLAAHPIAAAQNPPLGEVARKEQERRKTVKKGGDKVLTNKDLPPAAARPAPAPAAPGTGAPAGATGPETRPPATTAKDEEKEEAWWRQRITQAREGLRRSEVFLEALQTRVNVLSADFVNRDDPVQRARVGEDRQKALAEMERVQAEIASFKKQIEDIEEEARKAGIPPGWLR